MSKRINLQSVLCCLLLSIGLQPVIMAHGTVTSPPSRIWRCYLEGPESPDSPACIDAVATHGTQPLYDWAAINQGFANGNHQAVVPDGNLASGGNPAKYGGMDQVRSDWVSTDVVAGPFTVSWNNSAPHATEYFRVYITTANWTPDMPLSWDMLELLVETPPSAAESDVDIDVVLPARTGQHAIFSVWQRSDSPEAFYSVSDITYGVSEPPVNESAKVTVEDDLDVIKDISLGEELIFQNSMEDKFKVTYNGSAEKLTIEEVGVGIALEIKAGEIYLPQYAGADDKVLGLNSAGKLVEAASAPGASGSLNEYVKFDFNNTEVNSGYKETYTGTHFSNVITLQGLSGYLLDNNAQSGSDDNSVTVQLVRQNKINNALADEVIYEVVGATTASQVFTSFQSTAVVTPGSNVINNNTYVYFLKVSYCDDCDFRHVSVLK